MMRNPTEIYGQMREFVWGVVVEVHEVGPYSIVEYFNEKSGNREFHPYVEGEDTNRGCLSLEEALLAAMGYRHIGLNTDFAYLTLKMLGF